MQSILPTPSPEQPAELPSLNVIRTETVLSRYPVHKLAKQGSVSIEIREENEDGELRTQWEVSHNSKYGQPGPLAYKLDTLIINRRIEEGPRPIPKIIKLGSLREICEELGVSTHNTTQSVKKALYQNAFAGIAAKLTYKASDGTEQTLEAGFTRYSVVFTGEKFPDGRAADAVYLILNDIFMQVINQARTRPLDYDYLKELPPGPQRFYELLSYQVFAALKHSRPRAKLAYSEYCTYAPQSRYFDFDHVKKQMYKIHVLHKKYGYITNVEFEATTDREDRPDWLMLYTPGPKARAEYRTFTRKGGVVLDIDPVPAAGAKPDPPKADISPKSELQEPKLTELETALAARGVTPSTATELVAGFPAEHVQARLEAFDWLVEKKDKRVSKSPGGYLADSIRKGYTTPKGFESKADRTKRLEAEEGKQRQAAEAKRRAEAAERAREEAEQARIDGYWNSLSPADQEALRAEAMAKPNPFVIGLYRKSPKGSSEAERYLKIILHTHITGLLDQRDAAQATA